MSETPPRIAWREEFALGLPSIDHEHRELIALINHIFACAAAADRERVTAELGETYARISAHFALEEQMMRDRGYDAYADHKADHERLLDEIRELMDAYEAGSYETRREAFASRLEAWFVTHFRTQDARLHRHRAG